MMRRIACLAAMLAGASLAPAQMPPSISKPIEAAKKNVAATNAQSAAANQQPATPAATKAAPAKPKVVEQGKAPAKPAMPDSNRITFEREVFTYAPRELDPFASPIETGAIRPLVADLKLVGVIYDPAGRNSVAVMRDISTQQQYRAKAGQKLGRAKVTQIRPQEVVLSIDEYGFSRQEILKLNTSQQTQQTKGKP